MFKSSFPLFYSFYKQARNVDSCVILLTEKLSQFSIEVQRRSTLSDSSNAAQLSRSIREELALTESSYQKLSSFLEGSLIRMLQTRGLTQAITCYRIVLTDLKLKLSDLDKSFAELASLRNQELKGQAQRKQAFEYTGPGGLGSGLETSFGISNSRGQGLSFPGTNPPRLTSGGDSSALMTLGLNTPSTSGGMFSTLLEPESDDDEPSGEHIPLHQNTLGPSKAAMSQASMASGSLISNPHQAYTQSQKHELGSAGASYSGSFSQLSMPLPSNPSFSNYLGGNPSGRGGMNHGSFQPYEQQQAHSQMDMNPPQEEADRAQLFSELLKIEEEASSETVALMQRRDYNSRTAYLQERNDAIDQIRSTVEEVATMYKRFNELVHVQEEMLIRIDNNVDETSVNIEEGHFELIKYLESLSSNSWLIIKIFGILIIFSILFVTILK